MNTQSKTKREYDDDRNAAVLTAVPTAVPAAPAVPAAVPVAAAVPEAANGNAAAAPDENAGVEADAYNNADDTTDDDEDYADCDVFQLRKLCRKRQLTHSGPRTRLLKKLKAWDFL